MEASPPMENSQLRRHLQQKNRDRYPFVTSIREQGSYHEPDRRSSPTIHLLSYMAEFIDDEVKAPPAKPLELSQFQKLKQHNESHHFDYDFRSAHSLYKKEAAKPLQSGFTQSSKQLKGRVAKQLEVFNRTASSSKHRNQMDVSKDCQRDKTPIVQEIKTRIRESLANYIRSNDRKDIEARVLQLSEQHEKKTEELLKEVAKLRQLNQQQAQQHERQVLEMTLEQAKVNTDNERLKQECERTVRQLEKCKASTNDLKEFRKEYKELVESYPDMTCSKLLKEYKRLEHVCLTRLDDLDKELVDRFEDEKRPLEARVEKLSSENKALKQQLAELKRVADGRHLIDSLDYFEIEDLKKSKQELIQLQKKVLEIFVRWQQNKTEGEKQVLQHYCSFTQQYSYIQMLDYMQFDKRELCTDEKTREFLRRTLGLIQMTRRKLFNEAVPDKKNPEKILEQIVRLVVGLRKQIKHSSPRSGKLEG